MDNQKQSNQMCNGQCAQCQFQQRVYCAAYLSRNNYAMMASVLERLDAMVNEMAEMRERINAIQSNEGELMKPFDVGGDSVLETKDTQEAAV